MNYSVLYRGQLASCNYGCTYCPFAKRVDSAAMLAKDRAGLENFERWISAETTHRWRVLFTPWGEALVRSWYRHAICRLSKLEHLESVAVQTNLSCSLSWLNDCDRTKVALWATYHPTETRLDQFVRKVRRVRDAGVRLSVGMVAVPEFFAEIARLREALPSEIYLWINPQKPRQRPYTDHEVDFLTSIDPHYPITSRQQRTIGLPCRTGATSFTVDGVGAMRRCHFVDELIGNINDTQWESSLQPRPCPNRSCHCFLGLAHFEPLQLDAIYGETLLERIPIRYADALFPDDALPQGVASVDHQRGAGHIA